jgi:uncharacterized protein YbjT (DUF2867 family)
VHQQATLQISLTKEHTMKVIVFGGAGLLGRAIATELSSHGHQVVTAGRTACDVVVDYRFDNTPELFADIVRGADIVVNAAGILIERADNTFAAVHVAAPAALFKACQTERVARIVHISSLGAGTGIPGAYMASKLAAEQALQAGSVDYAIVRPALLADAACPSTRLFQWLAKLPVVALPGLLHPGASLVAPIRVQDVAEAVTRMCEYPKALRRSIELAGPEVMTYKTMLQRYREATHLEAGKGAALWLPLPWWLMKASALFAAYLPQSVFSIDTLRMLQAGSVAQSNEALYWLRHMPKPAVAQQRIAGTAIQTEVILKG